MFYLRITMNKASANRIGSGNPADRGLHKSHSRFSGAFFVSCREKGKFFIFKHMNIKNTPECPWTMLVRFFYCCLLWLILYCFLL